MCARSLRAHCAGGFIEIAADTATAAGACVFWIGKTGDYHMQDWLMFKLRLLLLFCVCTEDLLFIVVCGCGRASPCMFYLL